MGVKDVQARLKKFGFYHGKIDGIRGPQTIRAIKMFQSARGLVADGLVGPKTAAVLFVQLRHEEAIVVPSVAIDAAPWIGIGYKAFGKHEVRNRRWLSGWLKWGKSGLGDPATTPWCGAFVLKCMSTALPDEPMPMRTPLLAADWLTFGETTNLRYGAIGVFWRGSPKSWKGHVGIIIGQSPDGKYLRVLGGNQGNAVTETWIAATRLRQNGLRWPVTALQDEYPLPKLKRNGQPISTNEA